MDRELREKADKLDEVQHLLEEREELLREHEKSGSVVRVWKRGVVRVHFTLCSWLVNASTCSVHFDTVCVITISSWLPTHPQTWLIMNVCVCVCVRDCVGRTWSIVWSSLRKSWGRRRHSSKSFRRLSSKSWGCQYPPVCLLQVPCGLLCFGNWLYGVCISECIWFTGSKSLLLSGPTKHVLSQEYMYIFRGGGAFHPPPLKKVLPSLKFVGPLP